MTPSPAPVAQAERPVVLPGPRPARLRSGPVGRAVAPVARAVAPVALLTAACGAAAPARPAAGVAAETPPTRSAGPASAPGTTATTPPSAAAPTAPAATRPAGSGTTAPTATDPPPSGVPSSAPLRVELGARCLVPGSRQRLVVETLPNAFVAFDNLYPDDRTGAVHGGAEPHGRADADGRYEAVWLVASGAPRGRVRVDVGVSAKAGSAITMAYYRLAASCS